MLILASQSPRRRELLSLVAEEFRIIPSEAAEEEFSGGPVEEYVKALALSKAEWVLERHPKDTVLGADTVVVLSGKVLGKPKNPDEARAMLSSLSGQVHSVFTGVCIMTEGKKTVFAEETKLRFRKLAKAEIESYVESGEPLDKAGAYGIQGRAGGFVEEISGDYFNVVGLPVKRTVKELTDFWER